MPDVETAAMQLYACIKRHQALIQDACLCKNDDDFITECAIANDELYVTAERIICGDDNE